MSHEKIIISELSLLLGFLFTLVISFADASGWRLLNAYYRKSRKQIDQKWKYIFSVRSGCETCQKPIPSLYLIPVLGIVLTSFRCVHCREPISKRFFWLELAGWLYGSLLIYYNPHPGYILFSASYLILIYLIAMIDREFLLIPTEAIFFVMLIGIAETLFFSNDVTMSFLIAFSWFFLFYILRIISRHKMGLADVRLVFALSLGLSFPYSLYMPVLASLLGIGYHIAESIYHKKSLDLKAKIPFGLFMGLAFLILRSLPSGYHKFLL